VSVYKLTMQSHLILAQLLALALASLVGAHYNCIGPACCNYKCTSKDGHCRPTKSGSVPAWWPHDSCQDYISKHYSPTIACSEALLPYSPCGLDIPHACGYGLACGAPPGA
jgi:hypothetical protein